MLYQGYSISFGISQSQQSAGESEKILLPLSLTGEIHEVLDFAD